MKLDPATSNWNYKPLVPLSWLFGGTVKLRNLAYDRNWLKQVRVSAFVISVGNLSVGGTGKTPIVAHLVNRLMARGLKTVIVARGYRRQSRDTCVVSDGQSVLAGIAEAGDEPMLLAHECPGAAVVVDRQKSHAAVVAWQKFEPDAIVVDDGFQHRRLARDLDIVMLSESMLQHTPRVLPAGPMRESLEGLRRADIVLINSTNSHQNTPHDLILTKCREQTGAHCWRVSYVPAALQSLDGDRAESLDGLRDQPVMLVSGIAAPERFHASVRSCGAAIREHMKFSDHHAYSPSDGRDMVARFHQSGAAMLVTTTKDAVKLRQFNFWSELPCFALRLHVAVPDDFETMVLSCLHASRPANHSTTS